MAIWMPTVAKESGKIGAPAKRYPLGLTHRCPRPFGDHATSERHTCRVSGLARSSQQYRPVPRDDNELRQALIRLAKQYGRYCYRKGRPGCAIGSSNQWTTSYFLLHVEGWKVNHKKVERLWREERLQLPQRHIGAGQANDPGDRLSDGTRKRLYHKDSSIIRLRPTHPNHIWAIDFVHDKLSN